MERPEDSPVSFEKGDFKHKSAFETHDGYESWLFCPQVQSVTPRIVTAKEKSSEAELDLRYSEVNEFPKLPSNSITPGMGQPSSNTGLLKNSLFYAAILLTRF